MLDQDGGGVHESHTSGHSTPPTANKSSRTPPALSRLRNSSSRFYSPELIPIQHNATNDIRLDATAYDEGNMRHLGARMK